MPTVKELEGIVDYGRANPSIDPSYFPNTLASGVWTGTQRSDYAYNAWATVFGDGKSGHYLLSNAYPVRLVHGAQ